MSSHSSGLSGEQQACDYLRSLGFKILRTRYRAADGEIDIVAEDGKVLCFVEVKHRPEGRLGDGLQSVDLDKRRRMRRAARAWLDKHPGHRQWRLDCLEITRAGVWYAKHAAQL